MQNQNKFTATLLFFGWISCKISSAILIPQRIATKAIQVWKKFLQHVELFSDL